MKNKSTKQSRVLSDHKKIGKKFVPPMMQISNVESVSFATQAIPEFLWLAILNYHFGWKQGVELSLSLALKTCKALGISEEELRKPEGKSPKEIFAISSSYNSLTDEQKSEIVRSLKISLEWELLIEAFSPIFSLYPQFPLGFIFENAQILPKTEDITYMKFVITPLYTKTDKDAVAMYANAIYITAATNKIQFVKGSGIEDFPEIEKYPNTEKSRAVADFARTSILSVFGISETPPDWANYFWNRGLEIEPC